MIHPWENPEGRVPRTHGCLASVRSARKLEATLAGRKGHFDPEFLCDAAKILTAAMLSIPVRW
jgi:hypothetical protein